MSDNISRKAAKDAIAEKVFHDLTDEFYGVMQVLDELPSTDRKGHWVEDEYGISHCSGCGAINNTVYRNFCAECGADMRGGEVE